MEWTNGCVDVIRRYVLLDEESSRYLRHLGAGTEILLFGEPSLRMIYLSSNFRVITVRCCTSMTNEQFNWRVGVIRI